MQADILQKEEKADIVCPECKKPVRFIREFNIYECKECKCRYPIIDSVLYLIKDIDHQFKSFQKKWYDNLTINQGISKYDPNKDGRLIFPLLKTSVDVLDKKLFDSFSFLKDDKVLDIGCNFGRRLNQLATKYNIKGTGIDISPEAVKLATKISHASNRYYICDAERLPFPENHFDYIISFGLVEHIPNPGKCLNEISRAVKKGGRVLIATINKNDKYTLHWLLNKISFGMLSRESERCGAHCLDYFLDANELKRKLKEYQFKIIKIIYSHSFFLLIYDEFIYVFFVKLYKFLHDFFSFRQDSLSVKYDKDDRKSVSWIFKFYIKILVPLYYLGKLMDTFWTKKGFSYYLYIIAEKE